MSKVDPSETSGRPAEAQRDGARLVLLVCGIGIVAYLLLELSFIQGKVDQILQHRQVEPARVARVRPIVLAGACAVYGGGAAVGALMAIVGRVVRRPRAAVLGSIAALFAAVVVGLIVLDPSPEGRASIFPWFLVVGFLGDQALRAVRRDGAATTAAT